MISLRLSYILINLNPRQIRRRCQATDFRMGTQLIEYAGMSGYTMWIKIRMTLLCGMCCHRDQMGQIAADDAEEDLSSRLCNVPADTLHVNTFFFSFPLSWAVQHRRRLVNMSV